MQNQRVRPAGLELLSDDSGSVRIRRLAGDVLYARIKGHMSSALGTRFAAQLRDLVASARAGHYFSDARALTRYDLLARSAFVRVVLEYHRPSA